MSVLFYQVLIILQYVSHSAVRTCGGCSCALRSALHERHKRPHYLKGRDTSGNDRRCPYGRYR